MPDLVPDHLMQTWGGTEATPGAGPSSNPAAGDAFEHVSFDPGPLPGAVLIPNKAKTGYRSQGEPVQGAHEPRQVKVVCYMKGSGTATTPVDYAHFFKAGGFTETVGGSDVTYSRTLVPATAAWLWSASANGELGLSYAGLVVTEIKAKGEDLATWEFTCDAAKVSLWNKTTLNGAVSIGGGSLTLAANHGCVLPSNGAPLWVQIDSEVCKVTAISGNTATLSANLTANHSDGATVSAYVPSRTVASTLPISAVNCLFDVNAGSEEITVTKWEATIKTGVRLLDKEAHKSFRSGILGENPGDDAVRYAVDFHYTVNTGSAKLAAVYAGKTGKSVRASAGETAGNILRINSTSAYLVEPLNAPEADTGPRVATAIFGGVSSSGSDVSIVTL